MNILSWLWINVVVADMPTTIDGTPFVDGNAKSVIDATLPSHPQLAETTNSSGLIIYAGDGDSNTDFGDKGANDAMEAALATYYPTWQGSSEWRRWQHLDLSDPYYRYAALINVFQYANSDGYVFKRNPFNSRELGLFPQ